jgi:hypothetical protein
MMIKKGSVKMSDVMRRLGVYSVTYLCLNENKKSDEFMVNSVDVVATGALDAITTVSILHSKYYDTALTVSFKGSISGISDPAWVEILSRSVGSVS